MFLNKYRPRTGDSFRVLKSLRISGTLQINKRDLRLFPDGVLRKQ